MSFRLIRPAATVSRRVVVGCGLGGGGKVRLEVETNGRVCCGCRLLPPSPSLCRLNGCCLRPGVSDWLWFVTSFTVTLSFEGLLFKAGYF